MACTCTAPLSAAADTHCAAIAVGCDGATVYFDVPTGATTDVRGTSSEAAAATNSGGEGLTGSGDGATIYGDRSTATYT